MHIHLVRPRDQAQLYEAFLAASITAEDVQAHHIPRSGFFEYPLSERDLEARAQTPFSVVAEDSRSRLLGYIIGYPIAHARQQLAQGVYHDPVHDTFEGLDDHTLYLDQLYLARAQPVTVAARMFDTWEHLLRGEKVPNVVTAIPQLPWKNESCTRFVLYRGFSRHGFAASSAVTLGLFGKPYVAIGENIL